MRLGVLDVGSNTVHLLVVDAYQGARPAAGRSRTRQSCGSATTWRTGTGCSESAAPQLRAFVDEALQIAEDKGVQELLAFATSAVRDAANGDEVLASDPGRDRASTSRCCPGRTSRG